MAIDPNTAYARLASALDDFHSAVVQFQDADSPVVLRAADLLADAYTVYDDALFTQFGIEAPFDTYTDDDLDDDFDDDLDDEDDDELDDLDDFDEDEIVELDLDDDVL
ncbi:DNA primase [Arcanobacterium ihumii]|uniref:DNA primase n=1 Tax=Arcanobacterium ihumii TaxID=2138162 RepID=UPI001358FA8E|nr:DNA primase [Arcanobacterium ihumii]